MYLKKKYAKITIKQHKILLCCKLTVVLHIAAKIVSIHAY